ncbi:hypothetical protein HHI36_001215 [Cryptolaemus montrouzieri]|uniref:Spatacsin n=1 Tax=Cryptolaemus montrouzieri TaxID=559131 RepID=A0ABD2P776_9CUCU
MIGVPSKGLRVHLEVANTLLNAGYDEINCKDMFKQLENTPYEVQNALESTIMKNILFGFETGKHFIEAKNKYEPVVIFSRENNIKLPEEFLRNCAVKNDWLFFMIFAQIQNYPVDQIKEVLQCFKNPFYLEHTLHCVTYDIQLEEENVLMRGRDSRKAFLSRIGVRQSTDPLNPSESRSAKSQSSYTLSDSSDILEVDILNTKATLLQTLIRCHNSADPPRALLQACQLYRNPLLAILATSYEPDSVHTNWLTWLVVSCELYQNFTNLEGLVMLASTTRELLNKAMEKRFAHTLLKSFKIFLPDNSLRYFLEFLCLGIQQISDLNLMSNELECFKKSLRNYRKSSILSEADHDITYLINRCWLEETALTLMASTIKYNFKSAYDQILFLKIICKLNVQDIFSIEVPEFSSILEILIALYESKSRICLNLSDTFKVTHHRESILSCLNSLINEKLFDTALQVTKIVNLPHDVVILMKCQHNFENRQEKDEFFEVCNKSFKDHNVTADQVIEFYKFILEKLNDKLEKYKVSKLSYQWARDYQLSTQYELEKCMWLSYINLEEKFKDPKLLDIKVETMLYKDMQDTLKQVPICQLPLPKDSGSQIDKLISFALDKGDFSCL